MVAAFPSRTASIALLSAAVWGLGLVVTGFLLPVYQTEITSSSGEVVLRTDTLVGMNGGVVGVVLVVPLLATVLVATAVLLRDRRGALPAAWAVTGLLAVFNVLAMLTIGVLVVPVTAALVVACASVASPMG